jgi:hypothetical protein
MTIIKSNILLAKINKEYQVKEAKAKLLDYLLYSTGLLIGLTLGYYIGLKPIVLACSVLVK